MKRVIWLVPVVLFFCAGARAQDTPAWEIGGGYSYLRANLGGPGGSFDLNGGHATVTENLNHWFGGRIEFNAFTGNVKGINASAQTITYGPVFSYRKYERFTPYAHAQFGPFMGVSDIWGFRSRLSNSPWPPAAGWM